MVKRIVWLLIILALLVSLVAIPTQAATPEQIDNSIDSGITWLVAQQQGDGSWEDTGSLTGFAVLKLEDKAFEDGYASPFDEAYPYHQNVIDGLNYIFGLLDDIAISNQAAGDPDTNGNGIGIYCTMGWEGTTYDTGIVMMAIAGSRSPSRTVGVGPFAGETYKDVLQDMVDYLAWGQDDVYGGWCYWPDAGTSDQSNSGYAVLGLQYAEASVYGFECTIPAFVKSELSRWIDYIQNPVDGDEYDGGSAYYPGYGPGYWVNLLKTGNLLGEMAFVGDNLSDQRVQDALDYIARHWYDENLTQGWGWNQPQVQYQAAYCLMKGLTYMGVAFDGITGVANWYQDFANEIVPEQNGDGSWSASPAFVWPDGTIGEMVPPVLSTEWALLTLEMFAPPPPEIEVPVDIHPTSCPNPLNTGSKGVIPVAILGTDTFDVTQVDPATVMLEGVSPLRWSLEDVATPFVPYTGKELKCDCTTLGPDGYMDLVFHFNTQAVVAAIGPVSKGDVLVLQLTGNLKAEFGGTPIAGEDVMVVVK
jgi:hypothetical protein